VASTEPVLGFALADATTVPSTREPVTGPGRPRGAVRKHRRARTMSIQRPTRPERRFTT
jgi:hypothetical protein